MHYGNYEDDSPALSIGWTSGGAGRVFFFFFSQPLIISIRRQYCDKAGME